jgi:hypothetical protein
VNQRLQTSALEQQYGIAQAGRERLAAATGSGRNLSIYSGNFDRDTTTGERAFREQQRMLPIRREMAKATRELAGATAEVAKADKIENDLKERAGKLEKQRIDQMRVLTRQEQGDYGNPKMTKEQREQARLAAVMNLSNIEAELTGVAEQRKSAKDAGFQARQRQAQAQGRVGTLKAEDLEAQSQVMTERYQSFQGSARRMGGMNVHDRAFALQAFKALQSHGPDALSPDMLAAAQQFAPESAGKILEVHGRGTREYQEGRQLAPTEFGDVTGTRDQARNLANQAEDARKKVEADIARSAADAGKDLGTFVGDQIRVITDAAKREIENRLRLRDAQ